MSKNTSDFVQNCYGKCTQMMYYHTIISRVCWPIWQQQAWVWLHSLPLVLWPPQATNIEFMSLYGNPALSMDEAGYYLTTLSVAANFIQDRLADKELKKPNQLVVGDERVWGWPLSCGVTIIGFKKQPLVFEWFVWSLGGYAIFQPPAFVCDQKNAT